MKAIVTRYLTPTSTLGARIKATAHGLKPYILTNVSGYGEIEMAEAIAAMRLCARQGWSANLLSARLPNGDGVFIFQPE